MLRTIIISLFYLLLCGTLQAEESTRKGITTKDLVFKVDGYRGFRRKPFLMKLLVFSRAPGKKDRKYQLLVRVKNDKSVVQFLAPAREKGRGILKEGTNMWLHVPRTRKVIRISPTQRLLGEASNGDVASINLSRDYTSEMVGDETVENVACYKLLLKAVNRKVAYHKLDLWVSKKDSKPVKSNHYAISGKLLKIAFYKEFKKTKYGEKLSKMLLVDPLQKGKFTWMIYSDYQKKEIADKFFRKDNLNRL